MDAVVHAHNSEHLLGWWCLLSYSAEVWCDQGLGPPMRWEAAAALVSCTVWCTALCAVCCVCCAVWLHWCPPVALCRLLVSFGVHHLLYCGAASAVSGLLQALRLSPAVPACVVAASACSGSHLPPRPAHAVACWQLSTRHMPVAMRVPQQGLRPSSRVQIDRHVSEACHMIAAACLSLALCAVAIGSRSQVTAGLKTCHTGSCLPQLDLTRWSSRQLLRDFACHMACASPLQRPLSVPGTQCKAGPLPATSAQHHGGTALQP